MSLSSWRAWIEIDCPAMPDMRGACRSPHGERGLKSRQLWQHGGQLVVALLMESVD